MAETVTLGLKKNSKGYSQFRITVPIHLIRQYGWSDGDNLLPVVHKSGILFKKVKE